MPIDATGKNFDECISNTISSLKDESPTKPHDQLVAIAHSQCRDKLGIPESKKRAEILRLLETAADPTDELLQDQILTLRKSLIREDWIDYGVILRKDGLTSDEAAQNVPYKVSWIKKYVNPIFNEVTTYEKLLVAENNIRPPDLKKSILYAEVTNIQKEQRIFEGWGSVEIEDAHGDIILIKALEKIMPTYIARGGTITFGHSNQIVGKVLNWQARNKRVQNNLVKGLWLKGKIFNNYSIDNLAWRSIKLSMQKGLPVLSLGATPRIAPVVECDDTKCINKYEDGLELYEFTVTNMLRGSQGANPEAKIDLTKSDAVDEKMKLNSQAVGKMLKAQQDGTLPTENDDLVNFFLGSCPLCQDQYQELLKSGKDETEAKQQLLDELTKHMNDLSTEVEEVVANSAPQTPEVTSPLEKQDDLNLKEALMGIMARLDSIESRMTPTEEPLEEATTVPTNTGPATYPSADQTSVTMQKTEVTPPITNIVMNPTDEQFAALAKSKGYTLSETSPAPSTAPERRDLIKKAPAALPDSDALLHAQRQGYGALNELANEWAAKQRH